MGLKDDSVIKNMHCSSKEPLFHSQYPHKSSQNHLELALGNPGPSSGPIETHIHINKIVLF